MTCFKIKICIDHYFVLQSSSRLLFCTTFTKSNGGARTKGWKMEICINSTFSKLYRQFKLKWPPRKGHHPSQQLLLGILVLLFKPPFLETFWKSISEMICFLFPLKLSCNTQMPPLLGLLEFGAQWILLVAYLPLFVWFWCWCTYSGWYVCVLDILFSSVFVDLRTLCTMNTNFHGITREGLRKTCCHVAFEIKLIRLMLEKHWKLFFGSISFVY